MDIINIIKDTGMSDLVLPLGECISIISLIKSLNGHFWHEWKRFETSCLEEVISADGRIMISMSIILSFPTINE